MFFPVEEWFAAFLLTIAVEVPIVVVLLRRSEPDLVRLVAIGETAELTGIVDHPEDAGCVFVSFIEGGPDPVPEWCRPDFVVTRIE